MADGGAQMFTEFKPNGENTKMLRNAFGRFATGVTIVTCNTDQGPVGMTANSFSSISLEPALVMWAPAKKSGRFDFFNQAKNFAIHVLDAEQQETCLNFASSMNAFDGLAYSLSPEGVPLIENCLARFECEQADSHDAGDHQIIIGKVLQAQMRDGDALAFYAGKFGQIQLP